jgi:uncharacterized membrane protein
MHRWVPSLRNSFALNQGPIWTFAVVILGVTAIVLPLLSSWEAQTLAAMRDRMLTA